MLFRKKTRSVESYDPKAWEPVLRASICTGERVAGFRERATGKFQEVTCIKGEEDLAAFLKDYGIRKEELKKEW